MEVCICSEVGTAINTEGVVSHNTTKTPQISKTY